MKSAIYGAMDSGMSTPSSSGANTPQMTRPSSPTQHNERSQVSMKKLWKELKHSVVEHHRSVNAAYACYYGAGSSNPNKQSRA